MRCAQPAVRASSRRFVDCVENTINHRGNLSNAWMDGEPTARI
jgi:hypothetical protein